MSDKLDNILSFLSTAAAIIAVVADAGKKVKSLCED